MLASTKKNSWPGSTAERLAWLRLFATSLFSRRRLEFSAGVLVYFFMTGCSFRENPNWKKNEMNNKVVYGIPAWNSVEINGSLWRVILKKISFSLIREKEKKNYGLQKWLTVYIISYFPRLCKVCTVVNLLCATSNVLKKKMLPLSLSGNLCHSKYEEKKEKPNYFFSRE